MKKLLVIADYMNEPQNALLKAIEFASVSEANIHLAVICYESFAEMDDPSVDGLGLKRYLVDEATRWWKQELAQYKDKANITLDVIWSKSVHEVVLDRCELHQYDFIVKTGHRTENAFYTPTDWLLFRDAPAPVYIVEPKPFKSKKTVLVAIDAMAKSDEKKAINAKLIEAAFRLSVQTNAKLHCAYVIKIPTILNDFDLIDPKTYALKKEGFARHNMAEILKDYDIPESCIHVQAGEPWGVLANLAKKIHCECLVVGSMGRKGILGKLIGNTAEKIISIAHTDLLVISPEVKKIS